MSFVGVILALMQLCTVCSLQQGEDLMVWQQYHYGMRDGVFLEMGALDGACTAMDPAGCSLMLFSSTNASNQPSADMFMRTSHLHTCAWFEVTPQHLAPLDAPPS
jgi:hypothetical protein